MASSCQALIGLILISGVYSAITCPQGSIDHPLKDRCYQIFNQHLIYSAANRYCEDHAPQNTKGGLAIVSDQFIFDLLIPQLLSQIGLFQEAWIGLRFTNTIGSWIWDNNNYPFHWYAKLLSSPPAGNFGATISINDSINYSVLFASINARPFVCEFRNFDDTEINPLCPTDMILHKKKCIWGNRNIITYMYAKEECAGRIGGLPSFPTDEDIAFLNAIWPIIFPETREAWVGLSYSNDSWRWKTGDLSVVSSWISEREYNQGSIQSCGLGSYTHSAQVKWASGPCNVTKAFLCMGDEGNVKSHECRTGLCVAPATCKEGSIHATCVCPPGLTATYNQYGQLTCQNQAVCQGSGDPHYTTWDGAKIHYQGICKHLFAAPCDNQAAINNLQHFEIIVFNDHLPQWNPLVSFTIYVEVIVYGMIFQLGPINIFMIDGVASIPPLTPIFPYDETRFVAITPLAGNGYILFTDFGLYVKFQSRSVTVNIPSLYEGIMCGICGDYDGDHFNDLTDNMAIWMLTDDQNNPECNTPNENPECPPELKQMAEALCGKIHSNSILDDCRNAINAAMTTFYDDCVYDSCGLGNSSKIHAVFCRTIENLVDVCLNRGFSVDIEYREEFNCPMDCPRNSTYEKEMSLDVPTCANPDGIYVPSNGIGEGCQCDDDFILNDGQCISKEECGCLLPNREMFIDRGEYWINSNCTIKYYCDETGELNEELMNCGINAECVLDQNGTYGCDCINGTVGVPLIKCNKTMCPYRPESSSSTNNLVNIQPGTWQLVAECRNVTCDYGPFHNVSDMLCVENAVCVTTDDNLYDCVCVDGFVGDGFIECEEDDSGTGDPHFMVTSHSSGKHLCYDVHGYENEVWRLIYDKNTGLKVNGKLFETSKSTTENPLSYFSDISIQYNNKTILFNRDVISYDGHTYNWSEIFDDDFVEKINAILYKVTLEENIVLSVSRVLGENRKYYLGIYVSQSGGLSLETTGVIGQFIKKPFIVEAFGLNGLQKGGHVTFPDGDHESIETILTHRFSLIHNGMIECWLFVASSFGDNKLLGDMNQYQLNDITE